MKLSMISALACASTLGLAAGAAQAAVTFVGYQTALNPGESLVTSFEGGPTLGGAAFGRPGYSLGGSAVLFTGSTGFSAAPATSATTRDATQYLSVQAGQTATLDTPLLDSISFYVGSLDGYNSFTFKLADGSTQVVTGSVLDALPGLDANGNQTAFTTNGRLTFSFGSAIDGVTLASGGNSLEVSDVGAVDAVGVVPEAATWALMILGFGGVGGLMRRRRAAGGAMNSSWT
ncbi:MAG: PEPxxWA-CTERM sorting domain-containing protein [Caulobacterales bacterium]